MQIILRVKEINPFNDGNLTG